MILIHVYRPGDKLLIISDREQARVYVIDREGEPHLASLQDLDWDDKS